MVEIKECSINDTFVLAKMNKELIEDEKAENSMDETALEKRMARFLTSGYKAFFFLTDGEVIGYALCNICENPVYLRQFYICRDKRRRGYGKHAFNGLLNYIKCTEIDIDVYIWNKRGMAFWESVGFYKRCVNMRYSKYSYNFTQSEEEKITNRFGYEFFAKIKNDIKKYSTEWKLSDLELIDSFSINCVFKCSSELYGKCILKICKPCKEVFTETNTLKEYNGKRFCKLYNYDAENGVILEELIFPGTRLRDLHLLDNRLEVFCSMYEGLHIKPEKPEIYPSYLEWVSRITNYMSKRDDYISLYLHMKKAEDICKNITTVYPEEMLLHGDFHHDNILLSQNGEYKIIDPKGVTGNPLFDLPRFILNEFDEPVTGETYKKIEYIIMYISKRLCIPDHIIRQCLYIETVMAYCWSVESGEAPIMEHVAIAEDLLNKHN